MLKIRAGLLYNLAADTLDVVKSSTIIEILYYHKLLNYVTKYSYYMFMLKQYDPPDCKLSRDYDSIYDLFGDCSEIFIEMFDKKGFSLENVAHMSNEMLFVINELEDSNIIINNYYSGTTHGKEQEKNAVNILASVGIIVDKVESKSCVITYSDTSNDDRIELNGKPDGIISDSPGNCYKPGTIIEIKSKRSNGNVFRNYDISQMSAYSVIFDSDVLYVKIYDNNRVECELLSAEYLQAKFRNRFSHFTKNCKYISNLINNCVSDDDKMQNLVNLCLRKRHTA